MACDDANARKSNECLTFCYLFVIWLNKKSNVKGGHLTRAKNSHAEKSPRNWEARKKEAK